MDNQPTIYWAGGVRGTKCVIGMDRDGVLNEYMEGYCFKPEDFKPIPDSLEAVADARRKGYKIAIITEQGGIEQGLFSQDDVEKTNEKMFELLGEAGCRDIDAMYYSAGKRKDDEYAFPNTGMFKRCEKEVPTIKFSEGYFVGHTIKALKAAMRMGAKPVLVRTGKGLIAEQELNKFTYRELKKRTIIVDNLKEFIESLA